MPDTTLTSAEMPLSADERRAWAMLLHVALVDRGDDFGAAEATAMLGLLTRLSSLARAGLEAGKAEESMRERAEPSMWATVVESDYDGELRWDCHAEGDQGDGDSLTTISLAADTFPVGTTLEIVEPAIRALPLTGGHTP